ncbi:reverse transcriptase domain-containing protein [Agarivorans sp. QJM3NY_33]|uniref:reverse transcriptase domain-containing protein n=1 Tax=Agarivorans sp. QJM3NY_33 TaxID=3421432 RepID=UPI003D7C409A
MPVNPLTAPASVATAWHWLCESRKNFPANADIWHLRFHRQRLLPEILAWLDEGQYRFSPMQIVTRANGEPLALWSAADAFVLKLLTLHLQSILPVHPSCTHVKGHGGHKFALRQTHRWSRGGAYTFVGKTDIRGYYANINKNQLYQLLTRYISSPIVRQLLAQFLDYCVEQGGNFHTPSSGIPRGCALSPLLAGFHLFELDRELARRKGIRYLRFMDDLILLCQTRWQLRRAIATMNRWFETAGLQQHPDKTYIGRIKNGFDWLGYRFDQRGLVRVAPRAVERYKIKRHRLYEQARCRTSNTTHVWQRVVEYDQRWRRWLIAGLPAITATLLKNAYDKPCEVRTPFGMPCR